MDSETRDLSSHHHLLQTSCSDNYVLPNLPQHPLNSRITDGMWPCYYNNNVYSQNHGGPRGNNQYFYEQGHWQAGYGGRGYLQSINNAPFYPRPPFTPYGSWFQGPPIGNFYGQVSMAPPPPPYQIWCSPVQDFKKQNLILNQINYYFSDENLATDIYLRRQMDANGWVPVTLIAGFRKITKLTNDIQLIIFALQRSSVVEVRDYKIRKRNNWLKWILPPASGTQRQENSSVNMITDRMQSLRTSDSTTGNEEIKGTLEAEVEASN